MKTAVEFRQEMSFIEVQLEQFREEYRRLWDLERETREQRIFLDHKIKQYRDIFDELEQQVMLLEAYPEHPSEALSAPIAL